MLDHTLIDIVRGELLMMLTLGFYVVQLIVLVAYIFVVNCELLVQLFEPRLWRD